MIWVACATVWVFVATTPIASGLWQYLALGFSTFATHLEKTGQHYPRISVLIPAWNEGAVIGTTIDRLLRLDYPPDRLRIYVVDDASTDETPTTVIAKAKAFPGQVFHIRRVAGGEGKAHTLNYGLEVLWAGDWTEAVLIMDADVIYTRDALKKMARHLADPEVGAVTAYIKEGSRSPNYVQRFITFEYITATGAGRRAQNVFGFLACLSGGAQLHSRENLMAIGGEIFSDTLAEDTFTTFKTQLAGRKALFEPNAIVYAEEPDDLVGLWKQRLRWARGNVQITSVFRKLWFNKKTHATMGSVAMGMMWFSIFLMPVFQIGATLSLLYLYFADPALSWTLFRALWLIAGLTYLIITLVSFTVDTESAGKSWVEGFLFPGVVSLLLISTSLIPGFEIPQSPWVCIPMYAWLSAGMLVVYAAKLAEERKRSTLAKVLLYLGGYGSFLCAVTFASYLKEMTGAAKTWDKTVKTGKVG